jgi:Cas6b C-terminal domain/Cas6b N-terminal domain
VKDVDPNSTLVDVIDCRLRLSRPVNPGEASLLRGFFGRAFEDEVLLHHHRADGGLIYEYPRVQFKVLDRAAHLIALGEGCSLVTRLWAALDHAQIGVEELTILETGLVRRREPLGETDEPIFYRFRTPWLGLNQDNHTRYRQISDPAERSALLERILIGNCLALAKAFGHHVTARLVADARGLRPWGVRLKKVGMEGFVGTFRINFRMPERVGIGKSVSRGFGTIERRQGRGEENHAR